MATKMIVIVQPAFDRISQLRLGGKNNLVETFRPGAFDEHFHECIHVGMKRRRPFDRYPVSAH
jgi:hypothetical protein